MQPILENYYKRNKDNLIVIAAGECAINGNATACPNNQQQAHTKISDIIPVHISIPGCPPSVGDLIKSLKNAAKYIK
jgi:Ni,Fe-hydrogenase III small subunit